eukprot:5072745-Pleurochrysis_carterae.AAC.1
MPDKLAAAERVFDDGACRIVMSSFDFAYALEALRPRKMKGGGSARCAAGAWRIGGLLSRAGAERREAARPRALAER